MRKIVYIPLMVLAVFFLPALQSCDEHDYFDSDVHVGHILCSDGSMVTEAAYKSQTGLNAVGVVFTECLPDGTFLAVLLRDGAPEAFCDTLAMSLGTSCSLTDLDGFVNTSAMQNNRDHRTGHGSPLGDAVFQSHVFGQSDYIPSVAEARYLYASRMTVNSVLEMLRKDRPDITLLDTSGGSGAWYWTSTEVEENPQNQAWLVSMATGVIQETPKTETHPYRAIVRVRPVSTGKEYSTDK